MNSIEIYGTTKGNRVTWGVCLEKGHTELEADFSQSQPGMNGSTRFYITGLIRNQNTGETYSVEEYETAKKAGDAAVKARAEAEHKAFLEGPRVQAWGVDVGNWDGVGKAPDGITPRFDGGKFPIPAGTEIRWSETGSGGSRQFRKGISRAGMMASLYRGKTGSCKPRYRLKLHTPAGYGKW
jgi:hypothetical protein